MQIGEQQLLGAQLLAFGRQRFFHFHDHLGVLPHGVGVWGNLGAGGGIIGVGAADILAAIMLHGNLVALGRQFAHCAGHHADAVFMVLDFLGYPDAHDFPLIAEPRRRHGILEC